MYLTRSAARPPPTTSIKHIAWGAPPVGGAKHKHKKLIISWKLCRRLARASQGDAHTKMGENSIRAKVFNGERNGFFSSSCPSASSRMGPISVRSQILWPAFLRPHDPSKCEFYAIFLGGKSTSDLHNFHLALLSDAGWLVQCDNKIFYVFILW